eukprot:10221421-Karenia_brevis.AAC.1
MAKVHGSSGRPWQNLLAASAASIAHCNFPRHACGMRVCRAVCITSGAICFNFRAHVWTPSVTANACSNSSSGPHSRQLLADGESARFIWAAVTKFVQGCFEGSSDCLWHQAAALNKSSSQKTQCGKAVLLVPSTPKVHSLAGLFRPWHTR